MTNTDNNSSLKIEKSAAEINTIEQLAQSLAGHTRVISDEIIMPALKQSREYKPIIEFFPSVKKHLIHSPDEPEPKKVILATEDTEDTELKKNLLSVPQSFNFLFLLQQFIFITVISIYLMMLFIVFFFVSLRVSSWLNIWLRP